MGVKDNVEKFRKTQEEILDLSGILLTSRYAISDTLLNLNEAIASNNLKLAHRGICAACVELIDIAGKINKQATQLGLLRDKVTALMPEKLKD